MVSENAGGLGPCAVGVSETPGGSDVARWANKLAEWIVDVEADRDAHHCRMEDLEERLVALEVGVVKGETLEIGLGSRRSRLAGMGSERRRCRCSKVDREPIRLGVSLVCSTCSGSVDRLEAIREALGELRDVVREHERSGTLVGKAFADVDRHIRRILRL